MTRVTILGWRLSRIEASTDSLVFFHFQPVLAPHARFVETSMDGIEAPNHWVLQLGTLASLLLVDMGENHVRARRARTSNQFLLGNPGTSGLSTPSS